MEMDLRARAVVRPESTISAIPAEGHLVENSSAEFLRRAGDRLAAERAIKLHGGVVLRQCPHDQGFESALREIAARRGEQPAAKAQALEFGPQIQLVDLAVIMQAARPIASVIGIAGDFVAELQERDAAALADGCSPTTPGRGD